MTSLPLAYVTDSTRVEWIDLGMLAGLFVVYLGFAAIWPGAVLRPLWWVITHTIYRLRRYGTENLPKTGGVMLVCNHVSYVDWMLLWAASPRRIRFVAWAGWNRNPLLRFFMRVTNSILVDAHLGPKELVRRLRQVAQGLDDGEVICMFPEARLTRTGAMLPFHRGFEKILKYVQKPTPVIPVCISQLWGSIFSYRHGRMIWKWPDRLPYPVTVSFGTAQPATITAPEMRLKIQELAAEAAIRESDRIRPMHRQFVRIAARLRRLFQPCLVDTSGAAPRTLSYAKALVGSICISRWLRPQIGTERNVGVWLPSSVGSALANVALAFLRRTSVNLNYTAGMESIRSAIQQTGMKVIITSRRFLTRIPLDIDPSIQLIYLEDAAGAITSWQRIRTMAAVCLLPGWFLEYVMLRMGSHSLDDIATIIFSSGSTGEPKGVMLSNRNISSNIESFVAHIDIDDRDRILGVLPFFHSFGYTVTLWAPLEIGASVVYHADPRAAKEIGELCRTFHCTTFLGTATFLRFYLRRCEPNDFRTLRVLVCGAEKLPPSLAKEFEAKFGILPLEGYGCTELSPVVAVNVPDIEIGGIRQIGNKIGTIGQPIPGVATRMVDPDSYEPLPIGKEGLLLVKGPNVMVGYLNKPEKTAAVIRDGWYITGDMGHIDEDGFITLTGRLSRFAKIGGEMVPLERLEEEIHAVLGTTDRVVAISAIPDEKRGERLIVLHLATLTLPLDELTKQLGQRGIPNLWIPSERDFVLIPEMPVLGSGKLDLRRVQEMAKELAKQHKTG